jgi:hypothetical protein
MEHDEIGTDILTSFILIHLMTRKEMTRSQMIVSICILVVFVGWLIYVSQTTCDPGEDCSVFGILSKLFSGIWSMMKVFTDLFWIAVGRGE